MNHEQIMLTKVKNSERNVFVGDFDSSALFILVNIFNFLYCRGLFYRHSNGEMLLQRAASCRWCPGLFFVVLSTLLLVTFTQIKSLYQNAQKLKRMQEYNLMANDISDQLSFLEGTDQHSDGIIRQVAKELRHKPVSGKHKPLL